MNTRKEMNFPDTVRKLAYENVSNEEVWTQLRDVSISKIITQTNRRVVLIRGNTRFFSFYVNRYGSITTFEGNCLTFDENISIWKAVRWIYDNG